MNSVVSVPRLADCEWTNGYHFDTALLLSVFLGMFGADRWDLAINIIILIIHLILHPIPGST